MNFNDDFGFLNILRRGIEPRSEERFLGDYYTPGYGSIKKNIEEKFIEIAKRKLTEKEIPGVKALIVALKNSGTEVNLRNAFLLEKCLPDELVSVRPPSTSVPPKSVNVGAGVEASPSKEETEFPMPTEDDIRNLYDQNKPFWENFSKMLKFKVTEKNAPALRRVIDHFKTTNYNPEFISLLESCLPETKSDTGPDGPEGQNGTSAETLGVMETLPPKDKEEETDRPEFCDETCPCALEDRFVCAASGRDLLDARTISSEKSKHDTVKESGNSETDAKHPNSFAGPSVPVRFYHVHLPGEVTKDFSTAEEAEKCIRDYYLSQKGKECCLDVDIGNDIKWNIATSPFSKSLVFDGGFSAPSVSSATPTSHSSKTVSPTAFPPTAVMCQNPRCDKCVTQRFKDGEIARLEKTSRKWERKQAAKMEKWERKQNTKTLKRIEAFKARKLKHGITESCV